MEVESATRRMLLADAAVDGYVVGKVWRNRLEQKIDGTGGRAIVVDRNNGWATPDPVNTQEYPRIRLKLYADVDRFDDGLIKQTNAEDKALALYRVVDPLMHGKRGVWWGGNGSNRGLMVVSCARAGEPVIVGEKDRHGATAGDPLGDSVYALVEYNAYVIH